MAIDKEKEEKKVVNQNNEKPKGVSDSAWQGTQETFSVSDKVNDAQSKVDTASNKYTEYTNTDMISKSTQKAMNKSFIKPSAVKEADSYLLSQLEKIQSGKTSYSDQVRDMMDKIMNREKFSYDVDQDPLFQQALASAMNSGKQAMQDTIGQASALTGGYGSTYATSAGNQAYNSFIEDAYDNLPQYYQMAMEAYQMEGDEIYRQYGMLSAEDDKEYNRNIAAYDATYQHRNQLYNEAYSQYRDKKSDAFTMAGIEMQEYSQKSNDLYNLYNMASNTYENLYAKEYESWADRVNNAWKTVEVENSDWWNQSNQDFQAAESEKQRNWQSAEAEKERAFTASENAKNRAASRSSGGPGDYTQNPYTQAELDAAGRSESVSKFMSQLLTPSEFSSRGNSRVVNGEKTRYDSYLDYVDDNINEWVNKKKLSDSQAAYLVGYYFMK